MTKNEAKREATFEEEYEILKKEKEELFAMEVCDTEPPFANCVVRRALRCIRKLLEEVQAYRAIGTVEDLKSMKENGAFTGVELASIACMQMKLKDYQSIGTIDEFKALKEKSEPKKDNNDGGRCKYCGTYNNFIINKLANPKGHPVIHCWNCGQAIDWQ